MSNQQGLVEHYGNPNLWYAAYPVRPELRCGLCGSDRGCGCNKRQASTGERCCGVAYKNGVPYDCNCNLIQAPYSMPYEAHTQCNRKNSCNCKNRAALYMKPPQMW